MTTSSIVLYNTNFYDVKAVIACAINSSINIIYVIDNSSTNKLQGLIEKTSSKIIYIYGQGNVGYGAAHNIAIREAIKRNTKYHVVINPDIVFDSKVIDQLQQYMDVNTDVGEVMPKVLYPNGNLQYLCKLLPTPQNLIFRRFFPHGWFAKEQCVFELRFTNYDKEMNVPFLSGCFMFFRIDALKKVGLFDERFFMYGEDIDLIRRIHQKYRTMYYPAVSIIHAHEAASYKNAKMLLVHIRNVSKYFNKWGWFFDKERKRVNKKILKELSFNK